MKRFCIEYWNPNNTHLNEMVWLYLYAYSEEQLRDMLIEYEIINIREAEL